MSEEITKDESYGEKLTFPLKMELGKLKVSLDALKKEVQENRSEIESLKQSQKASLETREEEEETPPRKKEKREKMTMQDFLSYSVPVAILLFLGIKVILLVW